MVEVKKTPTVKPRDLAGFYCGFQYHANSEIQTSTNGLRFSLPSIKFPAVSDYMPTATRKARGFSNGNTIQTWFANMIFFAVESGVFACEPSSLSTADSSLLESGKNICSKGSQAL